MRECGTYTCKNVSRSSVSIPSASTIASVSSAVKVSATCCGSLIPELSMTTWSKPCSLHARRASSVSRSWRSVQQMQPFSIWIIFSLTTRGAASSSLFAFEEFEARAMRLPSTFTAAISFTMTAMRRPWSGDWRMCRSSVVFPLPYCYIISSLSFYYLQSKVRNPFYSRESLIAPSREAASFSPPP